MSESEISKKEKPVYKEPILKNLQSNEISGLRKYQFFFLGTTDISALLKFEFSAFVLGPLPGAAGFLLRKWFYPRLFKRMGSGVNWGRNIALRYPGNIEIGDRVAIDDNCLLDAKGAGDEGIKIGSDVMIARNAIIQGKCSWIKIGEGCIISSQCQLSSSGGISLGKAVLVGGQSYIGGGRYRTEGRETLLVEHEIYTKGPVVIEDDVWIGAGVVIQDGVHIGRGSVIGSGAVVREDIPEYTIVTPHHRLIMLPREL